jgi:hypothetical protein
MSGGERSYSLKGVDHRPLFRLPRVLIAIKNGEIVYVVEGEKDVRAAERCGATATCNFDGAAKEGQRTKWKPEYGDALKDAHVVIVQDNDEAGRAHAAAAYRDLIGKAASVRIVQALVDAEHSDLSDHLDAGHSLDALVPVASPVDGQSIPATPMPPVRPVRPEPVLSDDSVNEQYRNLFDKVGEYLHLEDPSHIRFALAVAVSSALDGDPLWGMIVGSPSGGKTEAVKLLDDVAEEHVDDITGPALLSWTQGKNPRPTGILTRVGTRAFVSISDFSTILASSDRGGRDVLFSLLRRAYDGEVNREVGNTPDPLVWRGRLTLLAAVAPAIDNFSSHADALGPRWLYCRTATTDNEHKKAVQRKRRRMTDLKAKQDDARRIATSLVYAARSKVRDIELADDTYDALEDAASLTCLGRAAVPRHAYGRREIDGIPVIEEPGRITGQIIALAKSLIGLGEPIEKAVALSRKCALDTVPQPRLAVLEQLALGEAMTVSQISAVTGLHRHVARRALEDMEVLDMVKCPRTEEDANTEESGFPTSNPWALGEESGLITGVLKAKWRDDRKITAERLLSISGEDTLDVDRKYRDLWTGRIPVRFLILSNELPAFADASGAIAHRLIVLTQVTSFLGQEDKALERDLANELTGILNWSLDGLERLDERGRFLEPKSSVEAVAILAATVSPIKAFLKELCTVGPEHRVPTDILFEAWRDWCRDSGRDHKGTKETFGRNLLAAIPGLAQTRPYVNGAKVRMYQGVKLGVRTGDE